MRGRRRREENDGMNNENDGLVVLNGTAAALPRKTVLVLGAPRGGTSMVAGTLSKLGAFMGDPQGIEPFYENAELGACSKARDLKAARTVIARFNREHPLWGIKVLPKSWRFWLRKGLFHEPVYLVVLRDPLAVAKRRLVSKDKALIAAMERGRGTATADMMSDGSVLRELFRALLLNFRLLAFLWFNKRPALLVSYEKAVTRPMDFVKGVSEFIGVTDAARMQEAVAFVTPSPKAYVMRSSTFSQLDSTAELFGYLDIVEASALTGWALSVADPRPLRLELFVNGELAATTTADVPRDDVAKADPRFRAAAGFAFQLSPDRRPAKGDRLEVRIAGTDVHLVNSPFTVT